MHRYLVRRNLSSQIKNINVLIVHALILKLSCYVLTYTCAVVGVRVKAVSLTAHTRTTTAKLIELVCGWETPCLTTASVLLVAVLHESALPRQPGSHVTHPVSGVGVACPRVKQWNVLSQASHFKSSRALHQPLQSTSQHTEIVCIYTAQHA